MEQLLAFLQPLLESYGGQYGKLVQVIAVIGSLRVFCKPLMSLINTYVEYTPNKEDDAKLAEFKDGNVYKTLTYFLDWLTSIKFKK